MLETGICRGLMLIREDFFDWLISDRGEVSCSVPLQDSLVGA